MGEPLIRRVTVQEFNKANRARGIEVNDKDRDGFVTHRDAFRWSDAYRGPKSKPVILLKMCAERVSAPTRFQVDAKAAQRLKDARIAVEAETKPGASSYEALAFPDRTAIYSFGRYDPALSACAYNRGTVRVTEGNRPGTVRLTFVDAQGEGAAEVDLKDFSIRELPRAEKKGK